MSTNIKYNVISKYNHENNIEKNIFKLLTRKQRKEIRIFESYLFEQERAQNTIRSYIAGVTKFFIGYKEINKTNLILYKKYLIENYSPQTVNIRISAINYYLSLKQMDHYKLKHIPLPKYHFTEGIMSFPEYKTLCDYLKEHNLRYYFIVRFLGSTGARISELVKFTIQDLEKGYAECHSKGKFRRINIPQSLINESREFFQNHKKELFLNRYGAPISARGIAHNLKIYAEKCGIRKDVVHPHNFRHFFAIQFLKKK